MRRPRVSVPGFPAAEQEVNQELRIKRRRRTHNGNRPASQQSKYRRVSERLILMLRSPQVLLLLVAAAALPGPCSGFMTASNAAGPPPYRATCRGHPPTSSRQQMQGHRPEHSGGCGVERLHLVLPSRTSGRRRFQLTSSTVDAGGDTPPPPPPPRRQRSQQSASPISIESIAATLESGRSQTSSSQSGDSSGNNADPQQRQRQQEERGFPPPEAGGQRWARTTDGDASRPDRSQNGFARGAGEADRDGPAAVLAPGIAGGGGTGGGKRSQRNPNQLSIRKRRARKLMEQTPEQKQLQNEVALALKADSAMDTLRTFNTAMDMGVPLRANLLSGVLNQCAKAGLMDDCMRVVMEMKERGMVIEENTFVPIIRGMVSRGNYRGAFDQIKSMVNQGVQPRLRCYEPIIAGACREGDMVAAREAWEHMEQQGVVPREEQFVNYLCGLSVAGQLWETARSGTLDDKLLKMSYHARNLTMEQAEQLEEHFNAIPLIDPRDGTAAVGGDLGSDPDSTTSDAFAIAEAARSSAPLARRVKVAGGHEIDDDSWVREWSSREPLTLTASVAARKEEDGGAASSSCPACSGPLRAVGLTDGERARIRETLFGLAGLQVKKHARSRHTKLLKRKRIKERQELQGRNGGGGSGVGDSDDGEENSPFFSFTDEDQKEQLQIFVDWLHAQRAAGKTYTAVIDSANVAYHKGNAFHFSLPQVDLMVHALEAKGERPLVVIAEKYIDRVGDLYDNTVPTRGSFRYMSNPLNKAIVKRWRAKSQLYECSDEASDDWYWMFAAVAFDDIPMTVISNDRTRDHRMSLAETVPYLRWRTTQLAQFELTYALGPSMGKGSNSAGWPKNPPQVAIQPPPAFTRDVQKSEEGCWHVPAGADDEWLCIDVQRGLRMGLDRLTPLASKKRLEKPSETMAEEGHQDFASERGVAGVAGDNVAAQEDKLSEVGGLLQSMRVKKQHARAFRYSTQGTVEEAAMAAKQAAAKAKAEAAAADALAAEALFADAQTVGGVRPGSPYADVLAADAQKVSDRAAGLRLTSGVSDVGGSRDSLPRKQSAESGSVVRQQQQQQQPQRPAEGVGRKGGDSGAATAPPPPALSGSTIRSVSTTQGLRRRAGNSPVRRPVASAPAAAGSRRENIRDRETAPMNGERGAGEEAASVLEGAASPTGEGAAVEHGLGGGLDGSDRASMREVEPGVEKVDGVDEPRQQEHWASMTVVALKDELRRRGLKVSGKKAELVERLVQG